MARLTLNTNQVPNTGQTPVDNDVTPLTPHEMANIAAGIPSRGDKLNTHTPISLKQNSYARHRKNNHQKFFMKMHEISRLSVAMVKDDQICYLVGITRARLSSIRVMPEFIEIQETEFNNHMSRMSGQIAQRGDVIRTTLSNEVPTALATIRDCMRGKDLRVRLEAAKEWLDREGNFVKGRPNGTSSIGGFQVPESAFAEAQQMGDSIAQATPIVTNIATTLPPNTVTSQTQSPSPIDLSSTPAATQSVN